MQNKLKDYLGDKIDIEELIHYFDKNNFSNSEIKESGIVYTPKYICDHIVKKIEPELDETVFEPSVGHGIFIFSLLDHMERKHKLSSSELKKYFLQNVYGQDLKENNISELKEIAIAYFKKRGLDIKKEELTNFTSGDTLFSEKADYDIIMGNPPYVRIKNLEETYTTKLRKEFESCSKGNIDIYYAFIEMAHRHSDRFGFITPNSWLFNTSAKKLRESLKEDLHYLIDFKDFFVFEEASTYTSIFFVDKRTPKNSIEYRERIGGQAKEIRKDKLDDDRWKFSEHKSKTLGFKNISFKTPIATLRDKIYINEELDNRDIIDFYKISKIKSQEEFRASVKKILFPYRFNNEAKKYVIREEKELEEETIKYLEKHREELAKRDKGKTDKYESWFAYGRKQGLNVYDEKNEIVIIPGMISKKYKFFSIPLKDVRQPFLFSSGFILEVIPEEKDRLLTFLNGEEFRNHLVNEGKIWKGKDENSSYYSLSMTQIKKILN